MGRLINPFRFAPLGQHTYWRMATVGSDDGGGLGFAGLEFAETPGGADFASTATAITASHNSGTVNRLIDGNVTTFWETNATAKGRWVKLQFATRKSVREVRIIPRGQGGSEYLPRQAPTVFFIAGGDDDVNWTTYACCFVPTGQSFASSNATRAFPVNSTPLGTGKANACVWGLQITANNGTGGIANNTAFAGLIFASSAGGATLCSGGRGCSDRTVDSTSGVEGPATLLFDGNANTIWNSDGSVPRWVAYGWGSPPATPVQMRLQARAAFLNDTPRDWAIQWTDDGLTYNTTDTFASQSGWTGSETRSYTIT